MAHDGAKDYAASAQRPGVKRGPAATAADDTFYLFAGFDPSSGPKEDGPTVGFNDLWRGRPAQAD